MEAIATNKHELRTFVPEPAYRFLKENAGAGGIGQFIYDICLAYQKQGALDAKLERIERYVLEVLDQKKPE
jgi:hypothetical protein